MTRPAAKSRPGPWNELVTRAWQRGEAAVVQGVYRVWHGRREFLESFVAAPGPIGWRYFGRVHPPDSEEELFTVDHVVDAEWGPGPVPPPGPERHVDRGHPGDRRDRGRDREAWRGTIRDGARRLRSVVILPLLAARGGSAPRYVGPERCGRRADRGRTRPRGDHRAPAATGLPAGGHPGRKQ